MSAHQRRAPDVEQGGVEEASLPSVVPLADAEKHHHVASTAFDDVLLHRAVRDAGRWAYGTVLVEIWVLRPDGTHLFRPRDGWWVDPFFLRGCGENLRRTLDPESEDALSSLPTVCAGEGLPGVLWTEAARLPANNGAAGIMARKLVWRDVFGLAMDPDQPHNNLLKLYAEAMIGWAAACPFRVNDEQGIVVFMARRGADSSQLRSPTNEAYIKNASNMIGATYALREPRLQAIDARHARLHATFVRVRLGLLRHIRDGKSLRDLLESGGEIQEPPAPAFSKGEKRAPGKETQTVRKKLFGPLHAAAKKSLGADVKPPPTFSWFEAFWSFIGAFTSLLIVTRLNDYIVTEQGRTDLAIVLPPMGAFLTLLYGLTAAPASQPRNAFFGEAVSVAIALAINYSDMPGWIKQSLATALAIGAMCKLGLVHPPGAASCFVFSHSQLTWGSYAMTLVATSILIVISAAWNNLNTKRQYPTFWWGLHFFLDDFESTVHRRKMHQRKSTDLQEGK